MCDMAVCMCVCVGVVRHTISVVTGSAVGRKESARVGNDGRRSRLRPSTKTCWSCRHALSLDFHCTQPVSQFPSRHSNEAGGGQKRTSARLYTVSSSSRLRQMMAAWKNVESSGPGRSPVTTPGKSHSSTLTMESSLVRTVTALKSGARVVDVWGVSAGLKLSRARVQAYGNKGVASETAGKTQCQQRYVAHATLAQGKCTDPLT